MSTGTKVRLRSSYLALVAAASMMLAQPAAAQLFFDWGWEQKVNDTGRQVVRINANAQPGEIIVSFSDRRLYLITQPGTALSYPIAIPREEDRWQGQTKVSQKRENPSWTPTPTMLKENPKLPRWVPGGHPMNPLGNRALYLGDSLYRIHGTDAPWTIGTAVSKGCIRLYNKDALEVYERTKIGAKVLVTWNSYQATPAPEHVVDEVVPLAKASVHKSAEQPTRRQRVPTDWLEDAGPPLVNDRTEQREPPASRPSRMGREASPQRDGSQQDRGTRSSPSSRGSERSSPGSVETKAKSSRIETGSLPDRRHPAEAQAQPQPLEQAQAPAQPKAAPAQPKSARPSPQAQPGTSSEPGPSPDVAAKALEAAERAAAAAERAAAAAERAERAAAARDAGKAGGSSPPAAAPSSD